MSAARAARRVWDHYRYAVAYLVLAAAVIAALLLVQANSAADDARRDLQLAQDQAEDARERDRICESAAEIKRLVIDLVAIEGADREIPEGATPAQIEGYNNANRRAADLRRLVVGLFAPDACADGVIPPTRAPDYPDPLQEGPP